MAALCRATLARFPGSARDTRVLSADGLVMPEAAFPHVVCPSPREQQPSRLNPHGWPGGSPFQSAEKNRDWTKQFVVERQPFHHGLDRRWHDVDGKLLPPAEGLETVNKKKNGG